MIQIVNFIHILCQFTSRPVRVVYVGECYVKTKRCFIVIFQVTKTSICPYSPCRDWGHVTAHYWNLSRENVPPGLTLRDSPAVSSLLQGPWQLHIPNVVTVDGGLHTAVYLTEKRPFSGSSH